MKIKIKRANASFRTQFKVLRFNLLKKKIFDFDEEKRDQLSGIDTDLRVAFSLILKYHTLQKRIMFVGSPLESLKECFKSISLLKKSRHLFVPDRTWVRGTLTNKSQVDYLIQTGKVNQNAEKIIKRIKTVRNIDLMVILKTGTEESVDVLREGFASRIPLIVFSLKSDPFLTFTKFFNPDYIIVGGFDFDDQKINFFVISLVSSLIKKIWLSK
jgi:hypothetical protein